MDVNYSSTITQITISVTDVDHENSTPGIRRYKTTTILFSDEREAVTEWQKIVRENHEGAEFIRTETRITIAE